MAACCSLCSSSPPVPVGVVLPPRLSSSTRCCLLHLTTTDRLPAAANVRCRRRPCALPETAAASVLVAGLVGFAATLLQGKTAATPADERQQGEGEECTACGGTGLCPRCKGEGFVFKELPEETASRARKAAKNMATRYTAGLPTKWTYCNRCSSTRSCTACGGSGTIATTTTT